LPDTVPGIIAGTLFGLTLGVSAVFAGALAGSALHCRISLRMLKDRIEGIFASKPDLA
jgi:uncharacterized membrane protein YdjX (TVP38/TMEM64 family)